MEGVRPGHLDGVDVGQHGEDVHAVDPHERVVRTAINQRGARRGSCSRSRVGYRIIALNNDRLWEDAEAEVVADGDREHRERLAEPVGGHLAGAPGRVAGCSARQPVRPARPRSMRSGNVVASSTMIGQPSELPTNVARSTPTASQYDYERTRHPVRSSVRSGRMLRPIPGQIRHEPSGGATA